MFKVPFLEKFTELKIHRIEAGFSKEKQEKTTESKETERKSKKNQERARKNKKLCGSELENSLIVIF